MANCSTPKTITLAITGASGADYGLRLLQQLIAADCRVYLLISQAAQVVIRTETSLLPPMNLPSSNYSGKPGAAHAKISCTCSRGMTGLLQ